MIKSYRKHHDEYIPLSLEANSSIDETIPSHAEFREMISQSLRVNFEVENITMNFLYPFLENYNYGTSFSYELMINLWRLMQDNEYVTLMVNKNKLNFPKGTETFL